MTAARARFPSQPRARMPSLRAALNIGAAHVAEALDILGAFFEVTMKRDLIPSTPSAGLSSWDLFAWDFA